MLFNCGVTGLPINNQLQRQQLTEQSQSFHAQGVNHWRGPYTTRLLPPGRLYCPGRSPLLLPVTSCVQQHTLQPWLHLTQHKRSFGNCYHSHPKLAKGLRCCPGRSPLLLPVASCTQEQHSKASHKCGESACTAPADPPCCCPSPPERRTAAVGQCLCHLTLFCVTDNCRQVVSGFLFCGLTGGAQSYWLTTRDSAGRTELPGA
jgi:hypothetical protein